MAGGAARTLTGIPQRQQIGGSGLRRRLSFEPLQGFAAPSPAHWPTSRPVKRAKGVSRRAVSRNALPGTRCLTSGFRPLRRLKPSSGGRLPGALRPIVGLAAACLVLTLSIIDAYASLGKWDEASRAIADAMQSLETTEERWCEADVLRIAGRLRLTRLSATRRRRRLITDTRSRWRGSRGRNRGSCGRR